MKTLEKRAPSLATLARTVAECRDCPRLVIYREEIARTRRRAFLDWDYWGRPVPAFGDSHARLLIIGLAPAAHGGNRTGRIFTGDRSGDWLYATLHRFDFASQPTSTARNDGQRLRDVYITAAVHCAPPDNKPSREEFAACRPYLVRELQLLRKVRVVIALGAIAFDAFLQARASLGFVRTSPRPKFAHGASWELDGIRLLGCYHPSQRNTQTGFLTQPMFDSVFATARDLLDKNC